MFWGNVSSLQSPDTHVLDPSSTPSHTISRYGVSAQRCSMNSENPTWELLRDATERKLKKRNQQKGRWKTHGRIIMTPGNRSRFQRKPWIRPVKTQGKKMEDKKTLQKWKPSLEAVRRNKHYQIQPMVWNTGLRKGPRNLTGRKIIDTTNSEDTPYTY